MITEVLITENSYVARQHRHEADAKLAYNIWLHRVGTVENEAWEQLPEIERQAWREVIEFAHVDAECSYCGAPNYCLTCHREEIDEAIVERKIVERRKAARDRRAQKRGKLEAITPKSKEASA